MNSIEITHEGEVIHVVCEKISNKTWFHIKGETFSYEPAKLNRNTGSDAATASPGVIFAPMPGKVIKLNVAQGDHVDKGDSLLVMEAMKMEYNLEADISGKVVQVNCQLNDQVAHEQLLVKVQGAADES